MAEKEWNGADGEYEWVPCVDDVLLALSEMQGAIDLDRDVVGEDGVLAGTGTSVTSSPSPAASVSLLTCLSIPIVFSLSFPSLCFLVSLV